MTGEPWDFAALNANFMRHAVPIKAILDAHPGIVAVDMGYDPERREAFAVLVMTKQPFWPWFFGFADKRLADIPANVDLDQDPLAIRVQYQRPKP